MERIQDIWQKIKGFCDVVISEWGLIISVFLVALVSFGLGRLSTLEEVRPLVSITGAPLETKPRAMAVGGLFLAAKSGSVYYYPWCTGVSKIKEVNKVWFQSEVAARKAGYAPAKNCKGLAPK